MNSKEDTGSKKTTEEKGFTFPFGDFKDISKMMARCYENMQGIPDCCSAMMKSPDELEDAPETEQKT
jgi:hypothetical protein